MQINYGHHVEITDSLRNYVDTKFQTNVTLITFLMCMSS